MRKNLNKGLRVLRSTALSFAVLFALFIISSNSFAATVRWARPTLGASPNWSVASNWSPAQVPGPDDDVIFDGTSVLNSTIDSTRVIKSLTISSAYTGVITHRYIVAPNNVSLSVLNNYDQRGGRYIVENAAVSTSYYPFSVGGSFFVTSEAVFSRYESSGGYYLVYDVYGLQAIRCSMEADYKLNNDIDASSTANWNYSLTRATYEGFVPIGTTEEAFGGELDGDYRSITGLRIERHAESSVALFGGLGLGATVKNLSLTGARITGWSVRRLAGIAAYTEALSAIENCHVDAQIFAYGSSSYLQNEWYVGLISGQKFGDVYRSYASGSIHLNRLGQFVNAMYSGAIAGYSDSEISECYSDASISYSDTSTAWIGGIAGYNLGDVTYCYFSGYIVKQEPKFGCGGLIGYNAAGATASDSYYSTSGFINTIGNFRTPQQMSRESNYTGWNFRSVWSIDESRSYPYLLWSIYNWKGTGTGTWESPVDWNKKSGYPSSALHKAYINEGVFDFETPPGQPLTIGGLKLGPDVPVKLSLGNHLTLSSSSGKSGSLVLYGSTLEGAGRTITLHGDMVVSSDARFYPNTQAVSGSGTIEFSSSGIHSLVKGNIRFHNLRSAEPYKRITFEAGSVHTVEGSLYLSGEANREIVLKSSLPGQKWYISPESTVVARHLIVSDSHNLGSAISALDSYDGGNNSGWSFGGYAVSVHSNEGGSISPAGTLGEVLSPIGTPTTLEITAASGYYIGFVRIDGTYEAGPYTSPHSVTVPGDTAHSVEAYFVNDGVRIWKGGGGDDNWSTAANWTGYTAPGATDSVLFNSISGNSVVDANFTILNLTLEASFANTITQTSHLTVESGYIQEAGTFESDPLVSGSPNILDIQGTFTIPDTDGAFKRFEGAGTAGDPYIIYDVFGLQAARCNLDKHFKLNNGIDASATRNWNWNGTTHEGFAPIGYMAAGTVYDQPDNPFTGTFNGGGNTVSGLFINRVNEICVGLFGGSSSNHTKAIFDLGVSGAYVRGVQNVGGMIGYNVANVYDSAFSGDVFCGEYIAFTGGFVGYNSGTIGRCRVDAVVERIDDPYNAIFLGLFAGSSVLRITDCFASGVVRALFYAGGFVGTSGGVIKNSYTDGELDADIGGAFAGQGQSSLFTSCYYTQAKKTNFNDFGTRITQDQLKKQETFSGWDFNTVWSIDERVRGPYLLWEYFRWTGNGLDSDWTNPRNWSRNLEQASDYPRTFSDNVFLNDNSAVISTPAGSELELGDLVFGSSYMGKLTLGNNITVSSESASKGNIIMCRGTLEASGVAASVEGNFKVLVSYGTPYFRFLSGTGTVEMFGRNKDSLIQTPYYMYADFNDLRCTDPGKALSFYSSGTPYYTKVRSNLLLSGEAGLGNLVVLQGTAASPSAWYISAEGTVSVRNAFVFNSNNVGTDIITAVDSYNGGNNTRWDGFIGNSITAAAGAGGTITPEGIIPVASGETVEFIVTSSEGYYIGFVKIDGIPTDEALSTHEARFYLSADGNPHSIEAYFSEDGTRTWTGGAVDDFWSSPANWTGNATPQADERIVFNQTSSKNSVLNEFNPSKTIYALSIESVSSVLITQISSLTITSTYEQHSGRFLCTMPATAYFSVEGDFIIPEDFSFPPPFRRMSGVGTSGNPYLIYDVYGLQGILGTRNWAYNYKLARDIDASPTQRWNWNGSTHEGFNPIGNDTSSFTGTLDGDHREISGLRINRPLNEKVGLFGNSNGDVMRTGITNSSIVGKNHVSGFAGWNMGTILGCYYAGSVSGESHVGGIAGMNFGSDGKIYYSFSRGKIYGNDTVGGLVGNNSFYSQVYDSYSTASVEAVLYNAGGLVGVGAYIYRSYATGIASSPSGKGGLIGGWGSDIENSFFSDPTLDNGYGTLTSEANMMRRRNFTDAGWDFGRVWSIDENRTTPYFHWEKWLWTGRGDGSSWNDAENWNKHSGSPSTNAHKVFIGTSESDISTPASELQIGGLQLGSSFTNKLTLGNNIALDSSGGYEGSLYIYGGTFEASTYGTNINENFYKSGTAQFIPGSGNVVFANVSHPSLISGNTVFNDLTCTTAGKKISFEATTRQTVEGTFTVTGADGNQVFLRSSLRGITWEIYPLDAGSASVTHAVVQDSKNVSVEEITAGNSIDYGNNINWMFTDFAVEIYAGSNGYVNGTAGNFYVSTFEGGTIEVTVSPESSSYYIADVKIDGRSTPESIYHPGTPHTFTFNNVRRFYTFEAVFLPVGYKTWDGGGSTHNWSDALNWTGNSTPQAAEMVKFSSISTKNSTIDASFAGTVAGVSIESGYTGTIRQVRALTVNGSFEQGGGYFVCTTPATCTLSVTGNFSLPDLDGAFIKYSGTGTSPATAYIVHDVYGLQGIKCNLSKYFKLFYDIDASATRGWNWNGSTYEGFSPIGSLTSPFTGSFSGESFVVRNLWIDRFGKGSPLGDDTGLFGRVGESGLIHRFGVRDSHVRGNYITGGLVGANLGRVSRCLVSGTIVEGRLVLGGLVGGGTGTIEDSYSTASVILAETYGGVLCGFNQGGSISRSYAAGAISSNGEGFLGGTDSGTVSYCYYSTLESGKTGENFDALPLTPVEMKQQTSFETWDFDNVWTIDEGRSYPNLLWEEYNWTGLGDAVSWTDPLNWNKRSGYPSTNSHKAYINAGQSSINTPSTPLTIGALIIGPNRSLPLTLLDDINIVASGAREGSFLMMGGSLASSRATQIVVEGRFKNTVGTFLSGSTVIFSGTERSVIEGSTTFSNFYCTKEAKSLMFQAGSVQTIEGTLRISSEAGTSGRISLRSLTEGEQWYIHPSGVKEPVYFVDVQDSVNLSPETVNPFYSVNSQNNINWFETFYITAESSKQPPLDLVTDWGTIEPAGIIPMDHGTSRTFTATPRFSQGYKLVSVRVDGVSLEGVVESSPYSYTFEDVTANHSIEAVFAARPFLVTVEASGTGSGTIEPYGTVEIGHNSTQIFTVEADAGNYIAYVLFDGMVTAEGLDDPSNYPSPYWITFEGSTADHTIEVHYLPESYYIWSGLGSTPNWSEAANWTGNVTPDADSTVIFRGLSTKNSTVDAGFEGQVKNISMEAGYTGQIEIARIFTVEAAVSIESGTLLQTTHEVYVGGNWYCSGEAASFTSEAGAVIMTGPSGAVQLVFPGGTTFYDLYHSGEGKVSVRDNALVLLNDFNNAAGSGTFELYNIGMQIGGNLTNSSYFTQEISPLEIDDLVLLFTGSDRVQLIDMGGTGEGHILPIIKNLNNSVLTLAGSLETYGLLLAGGGFDAAGNDVYISTAITNTGYSSDFISNSAGLYITESPDFLKGLFLDARDIIVINGGLSVNRISCTVPSKIILLSGSQSERAVITIEASGYATFEGGSGSTLEYIALVNGGDEDNPPVRWIIDPQCPEGNRNFRNLIVSGSHNINGTSIEAVNSIDGGDNIGWVFGYHMITATHNTGGTIEPPGVYVAAKDDTVTYEVRAYDGSYIGYILKDGIAASAEGVYPSPYAVTFEGITSNHSIEAFFAALGGRVWTGAGSTQNWSEAANWSGSQVPTSLETAVFSGTGGNGSKDSLIDSSFAGTIDRVSIESGYLGTVTQGRNLLITASYWQDGGAFVSPVGYAFTSEGSFRVPDSEGAFSRYSGSGTGGSPYIIYDVYGLQAMKCYKGSYFELNNNISAEGTSLWNQSGSVYQGFDPIGNETQAFGGSLDGKGFLISGLNIKRNANNIGLFGVLTGEASNVGLINASVEGASNIGMFAGSSSGSIFNVYAKGRAKGTGSDVGGLAGESNGSVSYSYSTGTVEGGTNAGGLVGNVAAGTVTESYADVDVSGSSAGGLVGISSGTVTRGHFTGTDNSIGSFETAAQIKQRSRFVDWDFDRTWTIDGGKSSPQLMWEIYTWTGSADGTSWTSPGNWNKKSGYPQTREHKAFINSGGASLTISPTVLGGLQLGPDFAGTVVPSSGNIILSSAGTREGSLIVLGGTFDTDSRNMTIEGDFRKGASATFTSSPSRFVMFSFEAASYIGGSSTFSQLICRTPGKRLTFEAGSLQTITESLIISGEAGRWVTLESSVSGEKFRINPSGTKSVYFVSVKDSTNESSTVVNPSGDNLNLGNTSRWFTYYIYATTEEHATITPSGTTEVVITSPDYKKTYEITTESGYYIASVEVDGVDIGKVSVHTFESVIADHVIQVFVTTEGEITDPPRGLRVNIDGGYVVLSWEAVEGAVEYWIYRSANKFAPLDSWERAGSVESSILTWNDAWAINNTTEAYYIVRAWNTGGEGPESSMGAYRSITFTKNEDRPSLYRISLPYVSAYVNAPSLVASIDATMGGGKIEEVTKWVPGLQNVKTYYYDDGFDMWDGEEFEINAGDGIVVKVSRTNTEPFNWTPELVIPVRE